MLGTFVAAVFGLVGVVSIVYPDRISVPKTYEGGLEAELGGPAAVRVSYLGCVLHTIADRCRRKRTATSHSRTECVVATCMYIATGMPILFVLSWTLPIAMSIVTLLLSV